MTTDLLQALARSARDAYERLAGEYYDPRHITSRNFEAATRQALAHIAPPTLRGSTFLEVGAGRGAKSLGYVDLAHSTLVSTDLSHAMLRRQSDQGPSQLRVVCCAWRLPFCAATFDGVFAFLADPYNVPEFYREVRRVLKPRGTFIFTLPSLTWGNALRPAERIPRDETVFVDNDGALVPAPSLLISEDELRDRMSAAGFVIHGMATGTLPHNVPPESISPHVMIAARNLALPPQEVPLVNVVYAALA
jgi:SAM-dependent methyltransferase